MSRERVGSGGRCGAPELFTCWEGTVTDRLISVQEGSVSHAEPDVFEMRFDSYLTPALREAGKDPAAVRNVALIGTGEFSWEIDKFLRSFPNLERLYLIEPNEGVIRESLRPYLASLAPEHQRRVTLYRTEVQYADMIPEGSLDIAYASRVFMPGTFRRPDGRKAGERIHSLLAQGGLFAEMETVHSDDAFKSDYMCAGMRQVGRKGVGSKIFVKDR